MKSSPKILLCVSSSVAIYRSCELISLLKKKGMIVQVAMSQNASKLINPQLFQALTNLPVIVDEFAQANNTNTHTNSNSNMPHIDLAKSSDVIIVAPASANIIAKLALGLADDAITTTCLAATCPVFIAPSMNPNMWQHPAVQANCQNLSKFGYQIIQPANKPAACGDVGIGPMCEVETIAEKILSALSSSTKTGKLLAGKRVLVNTGATYAPIDQMRIISNLSSGKMGLEIAKSASELGAEVTLLAAQTSINITSELTGHKVTIIDAKSNAQMQTALLDHAPAHDIFISTAAIADFEYPLAGKKANKIKRTNKGITLNLTMSKDLLAMIAEKHDDVFCVGFAAESSNLEVKSIKKMKEKKIDMIVGNNISDANSAVCTLHIFYKGIKQGEILPLLPKEKAAKILMMAIAQRINQLQSQSMLSSDNSDKLNFNIDVPHGTSRRH